MDETFSAVYQEHRASSSKLYWFSYYDVVTFTLTLTPTYGYSLFSQEFLEAIYIRFVPWSEWMQAGKLKMAKREQRAWITVVTVIFGQGIVNGKWEYLIIVSRYLLHVLGRSGPLKSRASLSKVWVAFNNHFSSSLEFRTYLAGLHSPLHIFN